MFVREGVSFGGKELSIETGRMAKQADGSVVMRYGDTMVLVTAVASTNVRPGVDFMPLTVDYLEKTSAAGRIPGGYFKREGRMTEVEVLTSRLVACSRDAIVMVEGGAAELSEDVLVDALMFAHQQAQPLIDLQDKLRAAVGKPKREFTPPAKDPQIVSKVAELANQKIEAAMAI